ncbi:MAG: alpha/beta hydrolase family protein [Candidatus Brocadiia bacterium]|jgi:S-formylglutathione hydrolase FrmB
MALIHCNFFSDVLRSSTSMDVILPQPPAIQAAAGRARRKPIPTLWLLHGLSDDHTIWQRRTSIERYVAPLNLAVIMPNGFRGFYTDMAHGYAYWTHLSEEVPRLARAFFPLSGAREENFVAGLSMGGYGAFKLALKRPEMFAAAASLSGALDIAGSAENAKNDVFREQELTDIFGPLRAIAGSDNDLFALAKKLAKSKGPKPALYQCCGTEDALYPRNLRFREHARSLGLDLTYEEGPGAHDWGFWDLWIQRVLNWLPLRRA